MTKIYEIEKEIEETLEKYYECFDENGELTCEQSIFDEINKNLTELQNQKSDFIQWILKSRSNTLSDIA
jgi:uncharacterized membrane protein YheB (UPF0754 family)